MTDATASDVAMAYGTPEAASNAPARAPARARVAVTDRVSKAADVVIADVTSSWVATDTPPSLRDLWVTAADVDVAAGHPGLRTAFMVWQRGPALAISAVLYLVAWLVQHPARLTAALIITAIIYHSL